MNKGKIIFLNGVSSSGKTTLAKSLQEQLIDPFYWLAADNFFDMIPKKYLNHDNMTIIEKTISISHHAIKFFSDMGVNTIVDQILSQENWMYECVKLLYEYPVIFVHVTCPLEELQRREKERGDRGIGWAENQLQQLNPKDNIYDITVDTYNETKEECVKKIIEFMNKSKEVTAFKTLWAQLKDLNYM